MFILAKVYHPVSLICMNSNTVFRTEDSIHVRFLNYIITTSNTHWLPSRYYLVCVDGIPRKFSNFSIRLPINCGYIQLGKNAKTISHIQNFRGEKSRKKIRYACHLCLPLQIHSPLCATIDRPIEIHYQMSCALYFHLGRPMGIVRKAWERSGLPDSLPLKSPQPSCTSWKEGTTALKMAYSTQFLLVLLTSLTPYHLHI